MQTIGAGVMMMTEDEGVVRKRESCEREWSSRRF